jgi:transposase InsO family protein
MAASKFGFFRIEWQNAHGNCTFYCKVESLKAQSVIPRIKYHFARHGMPENCYSDNGAPYDSYAFKEFADSYGFTHIRSSPYHHQSNGKAENAVKEAKNLLRKSKLNGEDPFFGLLEIRNIQSVSMGSSALNDCSDDEPKR